MSHHKMIEHRTQGDYFGSPLYCVLNTQNIFKGDTAMSIKKFIYNKDEGLFGTFYFDKRVWSMLKTIEGMPSDSSNFEEDDYLVVRPRDFGAFVALSDFVETNGFTDAVEKTTIETEDGSKIAYITTKLWASIINIIKGERV